MGRRRTCDCGVCPKCKHREVVRASYWRNRDRICERAHDTRERHGDAIREYDRQRGFRPAEEIKRRARGAVAHALKTGLLVRGECEHADDDCRGRIEGHHDDYSQPLCVRWLCQRHHGREHRREVADGLLQQLSAAA